MNRVESNMGLAHMVAHRLVKLNPHLQDRRDCLISEAYLSLCEVDKKFVEEEGGIKFSTYAVNQIHNDLINFLERSEARFKRLVYLQDLCPTDEEDGITSWEEVTGGSIIRSIDSLPDDLREDAELFAKYGGSELVRKAQGIHFRDAKKKERRLKNFLGSKSSS